MEPGVVLVTERARVDALVREVAEGVGARIDEDRPPGRIGAVPRDRIVVVDALSPDLSPGSLDRYPGPEDAQATMRSAGPPVVVHLAGEGEQARRAAVELGSSAVVELPAGSSGLSRILRSSSGGAPLLAVVGAVGGAGATTVALACAAAASDPLLMDCDPWSTGLDIPLGIAPDRAGRWDSIPDTSQPLVADSLRAALPRVQGITVLTGALPAPAGERVAAAVQVGRAGFGSVVADCGRSVGSVPARGGDLVVIVSPATLAGAVATRRVLDSLVAGAVPVLAVRSGGYLPTDELADHLGVRSVVEVPRVGRLAASSECGEALTGRVGRDLARIGERILGAVG